ncbi:MAG: sigma-54 dependent transcriptional regulator [Saprospiraceae bacterium]|nr:sigma-54 dependent transcriptional regulator [Saprospiraceae bacterium]
MNKQSAESREGVIVVVDDDPDILLTLKMLLKKHFRRIITESNPYHLPRLLRTHEPDIVLLDMNFHRGDTSAQEGLKWLGKIKELRPDSEVIIITAHGDVELAVRALKAGATDFVEKPWHNDKLVQTVKQTYITAKTGADASDESATASKAPSEDYIAASGEMVEINRKMQKVSSTNADVLILGENGTGKEVAARIIHQKSGRSSAAFVKVDLGAIPDSLFESELFGHKKGAFTDAQQDRIGRMESAQGGTLFLDEIGNLSIPSQAKLLSALQNRAIIPLGSSTPVQVDFRLICATNMPIHEMVNENKFRQDLLYRINTVEIVLPPLRNRIEDIPTLANHFLKTFSEKYDRPELILTAEAIDSLRKHLWPGNIRELRHTIERAVILAESAQLAFPTSSLASNDYLGSPNEQNSLNLERMERKLIVRALKVNDGNVSKAAQDLGLTRGALYRRIEKFQLQ